MEKYNILFYIIHKKKATTLKLGISNQYHFFYGIPIPILFYILLCPFFSQSIVNVVVGVEL